MKKDLISIIIPCYNEAESLPVTFDALQDAAQSLPAAEFEYILVDDGSTDDTCGVMKALAEANSRVRFLSFSRNFGKEAAMLAGMTHSAGDYVCIMDADLQDSPKLLPQMHEAVTREGFDCAAVRRVTRAGEPKLRSFFARRFYGLMTKLCKIDIVAGARDFRLMTRQMTDAVLSLKETSRYSKGIFSWVGFKTKWIDCENIRRTKGVSKWSFLDLLLYANDAVISFSTLPLALSSVLGLLLCAIAFIAIIVVIVRQLTWGGSAYGWSSLVCIILFLFGIQLFCTGILGQYLAKTFDEAKKRPLYIIKEAGGGNGE